MSFKDELKSYINLTAESIQETRSTSFDSKIYDDISKKIYDYIHSRLWICVERKDIKSKKVGLLGLNRTHFYEYTLECQLHAEPNHKCEFYETENFGRGWINIGFWKDAQEIIRRLYYLLKKDKYDELAYSDSGHDFYNINNVEDINKITEYMIWKMKEEASEYGRKYVSHNFKLRVLFYCDEDGKVL